MRPEIQLACPVEPHEMDKAMRRGFEDLVRRVVVAATMQGVGHDLLLRVYLSGLWHGVELGKLSRDSGSDRNGEDAPAAEGEASQSGGA